MSAARRSGAGKRGARRWILSALLLCAMAAPVSAHKVIASIYAAGARLEGEIGFSNGVFAADTVIYVRAGDGAPLGEVVTDAEGFFTFTPTRAVAHVFHADLGAGHVVNARVEIEDLPRGLREGSAPAPLAAAGGGGADASGAGLAWQQGAGASGGAAALAGADRAALSQLLQDELRPLKREVAALKEVRSMQDILGGIGYIAGLFGLGFYIAARRKLGQDA
ncbi:cobalt ABC transporter permease [Litorivita sp. NS0012-18]|uniref:cobalt ABC transporter permease n=1 Tax=Litorivita sp. NS0012-18 TaxID=3127655 RepID=UPI0031032936